MGDWLYLAGVTSDRGPDMASQLQGVNESLQRVLAAEGGTLDDIVRTVIYTTNIPRWREASAARPMSYPGAPPASTLVQVVALARPQWLVEVDALAHLGDPANGGGSAMPKRATNYLNVAPPSGLFSLSVRAGGWLHLAGATARGTPAEHGGLVAQTEAILEKIKTMLEAEGGSMRNVVKTVIYVTELDRWAETAPLRRRYFGEEMPASTLVQVVALAAPHFVIEIEAVAYLGG